MATALKFGSQVQKQNTPAFPGIIAISAQDLAGHEFGLVQNQDGEIYDDVLNRLNDETACHFGAIRDRCCIQVQMAMYVLGSAQTLSIHRRQMWLSDKDGAQEHITDK